MSITLKGSPDSKPPCLPKRAGAVALLETCRLDFNSQEVLVPKKRPVMKVRKKAVL